MIVDAILEHLRSALQANLIDSMSAGDDTRAGFVKIGPYQGDPTPEEGRITVSIHENDPDGISGAARAFPTILPLSLRRRLS